MDKLVFQFFMYIIDWHGSMVFFHLNPNTCLFFSKKLVQVKDVIKPIWLLILNMEIHHASHLWTPYNVITSPMRRDFPLCQLNWELPISIPPTNAWLLIPFLSPAFDSWVREYIKNGHRELGLIKSCSKVDVEPAVLVFASPQCCFGVSLPRPDTVK